MVIIRTVFRTLFYQFLVLFVGISIGFICNAEWVGWKSEIVSRSVANIFFPLSFNADTCQSIKNWGKFKIYSLHGCPEGFTIVEDGLMGEEWYICKFQYTDSENKTREKIESVRIRWKTWEYYYEDPTPETEESLREYWKNGDLNSKETDKAFRLYDEKKKREKENEEDRIIKHSYNFFSFN